MKKIPSRISEIRLNSTTFKGTGTTINPTYVNFFFGNNGAGKSTIAEAIQSGKDIIYASGKTKADFLTLVYNQDFIDKNMSSYNNLTVIYIIGEGNKKIQEEIDRIEHDEISQLNREISAIKEKYTGDKEAVETEIEDLRAECWDNTRELHRMF